MNFFVVQFDALIVGAYFGAVELGVYVFAKRLASIPTEVFGAVVGRLLLPRFTLAVEESDAAFFAVWTRMFGFALWGGALVLFPMVIYADWLVITIFGTQWNAAGSLLQVLAIAAVFRSLAYVMGPAFLALGHPKYDMAVKALETVFFIPGIVAAAYWGQLVDVAWVAVTVSMVTAILRVVYVLRTLGFRYRIPIAVPMYPILGGLAAGATGWISVLATASQPVGITVNLLTGASLLLLMEKDARHRFREILLKWIMRWKSGLESH
jgi:PST family polysaccharide transporter